MTFDFSFPETLFPLLWAALWMLGGFWLVRGAFRLRPNEEPLVGAGVGLVVETWLANLLGRWLPLPASAWVCAVLVLAAGLLAVLHLRHCQPALSRKQLWLPQIDPWQWLAFTTLAYTFTGIGGGLSIFDDYAHLPTTSILAAGNIPPQFPLDPNIPYGYHYFLMLFAAQLQRLGSLYPWSALDISRGISFGLAILLAGLWVQRLTHSSLAGFFGSLMAAFGMGARWLLLLFPPALLQPLSGSVQMIGSGAQTAATLAEGLVKPWIIEGSGVYPFPFAFVNGLNSAGVLAHGPNGLVAAAITYPLLLSFNRWRGWPGGVVSAVLLASTSLLGETGLVLSLASWGLVTLGWMLGKRSWHLPASLWQWWLVIAASTVFAFVQGGAWTEMLQGLFQGTAGAEAGSSYQTIGFQLVFPPTLVSSHLGILSLLNPLQLLAALLEIGPVLLALPLVAAWGWKAFRRGRWYEAALVTSGFLTIFLLLVQFTGSAGVRNTSRLYSFISLSQLFFVPLVWNWARRRGVVQRSLAASVGGVILFGGIVLFGLELVSIQKPLAATFISPLDEQMTARYWNRLDPGALVFDPNPFRGPTVFGRYTRSSTTWLLSRPDWEALFASPDPAALHAAGFDYAYLDYVYWYDLEPAEKEALQSGCVRLVEEVTAKRSPDFRRLLDLRDCP